jgi:hypothetical protein
MTTYQVPAALPADHYRRRQAGPQSWYVYHVPTGNYLGRWGGRTGARWVELPDGSTLLEGADVSREHCHAVLQDRV